MVVVDPNNGRVLSIVNQKLALSSGFTPCSTFKPVVALAALKEGIITPKTKLNVGGRQRMDVTEALARSNNVFFHNLGEMLGFRRLARVCPRVRPGREDRRYIPGESPGRFPDELPQGGRSGLLGLLRAGYGSHPAANGRHHLSRRQRGHLVPIAVSPQRGRSFPNSSPKSGGTWMTWRGYLPEVKAGLEAAVQYGTARLAYDPEMQIYGKTGTCSEDGARLGWFVSYAQEQQPNPSYVAVVLLRGGRICSALTPQKSPGSSTATCSIRIASVRKPAAARHQRGPPTLLADCGKTSWTCHSRRPAPAGR